MVLVISEAVSTSEKFNGKNKKLNTKHLWRRPRISKNRNPWRRLAGAIYISLFILW